MAKRVSIIYNPAKVSDLDRRRKAASDLCSQHGYDEPDWIGTTEEDPGFGQGRQALDSGADLVCAMGGDGTVRLVAQALRGTGVPLGVLAEGTGNLLARNLGLPLNDYAAALDIALDGADRAIDLGLVRFDEDEEQVFCVIAGVGTDAETMANTDETMKKLVGWIAYAGGVAKALFHRGFLMEVQNDLPGPGRHAERARSYMVCNCGTLTGGLVLVPEAEPDDGHLDTIVLSPKGPWGWAAVVVDIASRHRRGHRQVRYWTGHRAEARLQPAVEAQLDGDTVGSVSSMSTDIDPGALLVRVKAS